MLEHPLFADVPFEHEGISMSHVRFITGGYEDIIQSWRFYFATLALEVKTNLFHSIMSHVGYACQQLVSFLPCDSSRITTWAIWEISWDFSHHAALQILVNISDISVSSKAVTFH